MPEPRGRSLSRVVAALAAELWGARRSVAVAALVALAVGLTMSYRIGLPPSVQSRSHTVGQASVLALVDTPRSQIVDLGPSTRGAIAVLSARARLLATLMVTSPIREEIARGAGIPPGELITMRPSTLPDRRRRVPPPQVASVSADDPRAHLLHVAVNPLVEGEHPIIAVDTVAPDAAAASRLASQAIESLKAHLDDEGRAGAVPVERRIAVRQLDPPQAATVRVGPSRLLVLAVALLVFGAGCAAIVVAVRVRRWAGASQDRPSGPPRITGRRRRLS